MNTLAEYRPRYYDASLVYTVEHRTTGANIHRVRNLIAVYMNACETADRLALASDLAPNPKISRDLRKYESLITKTAEELTAL